jgi:ATP-dependent DNA helicase RecG
MTGAFVKIGMFANDKDLLYQHEVHCPLIMMPDRVMEVLYLNYFKGAISYEGIQRIETYPVPHSACREAITNAICHRDYSTGVPIQIKVFPNRVIIYNDGRLPENWSVKELLTTHRSEPHNPMIANAFFRAGMIESWGRGIESITDACKEAGLKKPSFEFKYGREFLVTFFSDVAITKSITKSITKTENLNEAQERIISLMSANPYITTKALAAELGIAERNVKNHIKTLKNIGMIGRIGAARGGHWVVN